MQAGLQRAGLAALVLLLLWFGASSFAGWRGSLPDVTAYWRAGEALREGRPLYAPGHWTDKAYLYPPGFAAAFAFLTLLPPQLGLGLWMVSHAVALVWLLSALARLCGLPAESRRGHALMLLALLLAPLLVEIREGQAHLLMLACTAAGLAAIEQGRERTGGALLAAAAHMKVFPLFLIVALVAQRRLQAVRWMALWLVGLCALPLLWGAEPVSLHVDFLRAVLAPAMAGSDVAGGKPYFFFNYSIPAVLHRLFDEVPFSPFSGASGGHGPLLLLLSPSLLRAAGLGLGLVLIAASLVLARGTRDSRLGRTASAGLLLFALQLGSLMLWEYQLVSLALVLSPLFALAPRTEGGWRDFWIAAGPLGLALALPQLWQLAARLLDPMADPGRSPFREWGVPTLALLWLFGRVFRAPWPKD